MSIIVLDEATVSKIAAGEIIENPASIVKELIENSIDANSKNIVVEIKGSIGDFIRITDDGDGMDEGDLNLAFLRHATSKLRSVEDLNNIVSLGFRGEALASISHISKLEVLTKTEDSLTGLRAEISNGNIDKLNNVGLPKGTTFFVRDVFFNTPVRKKYLKNDNVEFNYIYEVVQKISLGNPDISIKLIRDNKVIMNANSETNIKNRIFSILGRDIASNLLNNTFSSESYKINIYFSNNKLYRSNRMHQYIYINGRYVKNLEISKIIEKYYYSLIPLNRYPVFLLYLDIDPILVDVNIHPKKHEVKLSKDNNVLAIIGETVEEKLYPNMGIPDPIESYKKNKTEEKSVFEIFNDNLINSNKSEIVQDNFIKDNIRENVEGFQSKNVKISEYEVLKDESENYNANIKSENNFEKNKFSKTENISKIDNSVLDAKIVGILFKTFIILENTALEKIYLVDQHAAHERIMYEKYKRQYESSGVLKQILLKPEVISLSPEEMSKVQNNLTQFQNLGFEIEEFGDNTLILREIPMIFGEGSYTNFIYDAISSLDRNIKSSYEVDPYKIMKKACKSAVKAGDRLSNIEVDYLLKDLINCDNPYTCPHGRPTIIEVKKYDIEKLFLRE